MLFSFICPLHFMLLPKTIALFQESYPNISVKLTEGSNGELHQMLLKGTIDLAIAEFPENLPGISLIDFYTEKNVLVIEKGLFARCFTIDAKECKTRLLAGDYSALSVCPFVLGDIEDIDGRIGRDIMKRAGIDNPIVTATSHNVGMLLQLSLCGVGACVCPQIIVQNMLTPQQQQHCGSYPREQQLRKRGWFTMAIKKYVLSPEEQLTEDQILMVREAAKRPLAADDDNPELTDEQLALFRRVHESRQADRKRQNITLRLTPQAIQKAKALGKGYSGILSRIVESVLDDPAMLSKYL